MLVSNGTRIYVTPQIVWAPNVKADHPWIPTYVPLKCWDEHFSIERFELRCMDLRLVFCLFTQPMFHSSSSDKKPKQKMVKRLQCSPLNSTFYPCRFFWMDVFRFLQVIFLHCEDCSCLWFPLCEFPKEDSKQYRGGGALLCHTEPLERRALSLLLNF